MSPTPHLFTVDGATFALGLFWQPLSASGGSERAKEIVSLAGELSFDLHVIRNSITPCVGFAKSSQALRSGVMSAAALISKTLETEKQVRDFIFVSSLPDGKWAYVAQRDGAILPGADMALASEDAARATLLEHLSLGDWALIVAPAIWGVNGSVEMSFDEAIPRKKNGKLRLHGWWRLLPVDRKRAVLALHSGKIAIAGVLALAVLGGGIYHKRVQAKKAEAAAQAAAEAAAGLRDESGAPLPPEHPWKSQPDAGDMMRACLDTLAGQRLFPGNWDINEIGCGEGRLTVSWRPRVGGWIKHLKEIEPTAVVAMDGSSASVSAELPALQTGRDEAVPAENDRLIAMYSTAQAYGVRFTLAPATAPAAPPALPGQDPSAAPQPDWKEISWKAEGVDLPEVVLSALGGDGFRMKTMRAAWVGGKFVWTMEGTQYVQP